MKSPGTRKSLGRNALLALVLLYAGVLLAGPLVAVCWGAFGEGAARFFREVTSEPSLQAIKLSLLLAAGATIVNTIFGTCIAWVLVRDRFPGKQWVNALVDLPFAVSPVIAGLMLILLFGRDGWLSPITNQLGIRMVFAVPGMLLATTFVSLPFVIREVMPVLEHTGLEQEHAAYTIGATSWQAFRLVTLGSIRRALLYGVILTAARALGEFGAVLVVAGGGISGVTETATLYIFRSLDDRNYVGAYSMSLVLALISFSLLMIMEFLRKTRAARE